MGDSMFDPSVGPRFGPPVQGGKQLVLGGWKIDVWPGVA
jgi:hypothetical protein